MQPTLNIPQAESKWVYATLTVFDGSRKLKPASVCGDYVRFRQPPRLPSTQIEILLTNGPEEQRHTATVLPHDAEATQIPIRLVAE